MESETVRQRREDDAAIAVARRRGTPLKDLLRLVEVRYLPGPDAFDFKRSDGKRHLFARETLKGLRPPANISIAWRFWGRGR